MTWRTSAQDAFINNPNLNSVYGEVPPPNGFQGEVAAIFSDLSPGPDQFAECTIAAWNPTLGTDDHSIGPAVRMSYDASGLISCYALEIRHDGIYQMIWEVGVAPGQTFGVGTDSIRNDLAPPNGSPGVVVGDVLRIEAVGNQITGKINGVVVFGPITDSRIGTGQTGLEGYPENSTTLSATQVTNFQAGALPSGPVQTPSFDNIGSLPPTPTPGVTNGAGPEVTKPTREAISVALFNLLANNAQIKTLCNTITRTPRLWADVTEAQRPFLLLFKGGPDTEHFDQPQDRRIALTKYMIHYNLWLYVTADPSNQVNAETIVNNISDAIDAAFQVNAFGERQTLGGLVNNCWIDGGSEWSREFQDTNLCVFWRVTVETGI